MAYASDTDVPIARSRQGIEEMLIAAGAEQFVSGQRADAAFFAFLMNGRQIRYELPLPKRDAHEFTHKRTGAADHCWKDRPAAEALRLWEQACRARWRALMLSIKARLVDVETGIESFEVAFLAHIVLPDGKLVSDHAIAAIERAYETGKVPALMPPQGAR